MGVSASFCIYDCPVDPPVPQSRWHRYRSLVCLLLFLSIEKRKILCHALDWVWADFAFCFCSARAHFRRSWHFPQAQGEHVALNLARLGWQEQRSQVCPLLFWLIEKRKQFVPGFRSKSVGFCFCSAQGPS